jgi:hypothetical protein
MNIDFVLVKALVKKALELAFEEVCLKRSARGSSFDTTSDRFTVQGFGMMRLNLEKVGRIHIWDNRLRVPGMNSDIHTHPWHLWSLIVSGQLFNSIYEETIDQEWPLYHKSIIQCGEGGGLREESLLMPPSVRLKLRSNDQYLPGEYYQQEPRIIHQTDLDPLEPIVTLIQRHKGPADEIATVYWPSGQAWMTAEPRPATQEEVYQVVRDALEKWEA